MNDYYKTLPVAEWFTEESARVLDEIIKQYEIKTVIEIGSFLGRSTTFFATRVEKVWAIDPLVMWKEGAQYGALDLVGETDIAQKFIENTIVFGDKIELLRMTSVEANAKFPDLQADLVYIDGAHDFDSVRQDIELWLPRAKKIIAGDDFQVGWPGVVQAVRQTLGEVKLFDKCPTWVKVV